MDVCAKGENVTSTVYSPISALSKWPLRAALIALTLMVLQGCGVDMGASGPQRLGPDLTSAIGAAQQAAETGNQNAILDTLSEDIQVTFGVDGSGHDAFLKLWRDDGSEQPFQRYATALGTIFAQGGARLPDGAVQFPWWTNSAADPAADPDRLVFLTDPAKARIHPSAGASSDGSIGSQIVSCDGPDPVCSPLNGSDMVPFRTSDGRLGYMPVGSFQSVLRAQRVVMERTGNGWKVAAFISGD